MAIDYENVVLNLQDVTMQFGGVVAVDNLNIKVHKNEIVGLIGPNGAGKTTAFNVVTGVYEPTNGAVEINGKRVIENYPKGKMKNKPEDKEKKVELKEGEINEAALEKVSSSKQTTYKGRNEGKYTNYLSLSPDKVTKLGVARTFQNIRLFKEMSVLDNVLAAMHMNQKQSIFGAVFRSKKARNEEKKMREEALELLKKVDLYDNRKDLSTSLPYGKQRHLEIARALATKPSILLLDEPAAGMNPQESDELMKFVGKIRDEFDLSILMIEHHMQVIMGICDHIYVLNYGGQIADGTPKEIQENPAVIQAYLGVDE